MCMAENSKKVWLIKKYLCKKYVEKWEKIIYNLFNLGLCKAESVPPIFYTAVRSAAFCIVSGGRVTEGGRDRLLSEKDIECSEGNMEKAKSLKTRHQADAF